MHLIHVVLYIFDSIIYFGRNVFVTIMIIHVFWFLRTVKGHSNHSLPSSKNIIEGENYEMDCVAKGSLDDLTAQWLFENKSITVCSNVLHKYYELYI